MKITIVGAGPAGLYAAILLRQHRPDISIQVFEKNSPDATFGFGVVFSSQALAFLRQDDPQTSDLIEPHMLKWQDIRINHPEGSVVIDGIGFAAIERLTLLRLLQKRAAELGIYPLFLENIVDPQRLPAADLVIGADGINSVIREQYPDEFGREVYNLDNHFVWFGSSQNFSSLTQTFIETEYGPMNAHHYAYAKDQSTFIIETTPDVYKRSGFEQMSENQYRLECEKLFAQQLDHSTLIPNHSVWRRFPVLSCRQWFVGNTVLVGDALHTAHFSIGSGTRLALEDVIALVRALREADFQLPDAFENYQTARQPVLEKITRAAVTSANWYETFDQRMKQGRWQFALDYIQRAGRLPFEKLAKTSPLFCESLVRQGLVQRRINSD
ncbi:MAG: FAD-dependent monooxygenase [Pseudomonadota bacterium]